jgi:hypothetical protein
MKEKSANSITHEETSRNERLDRLKRQLRCKHEWAEYRDKHQSLREGTLWAKR